MMKILSSVGFYYTALWIIFCNYNLVRRITDITHHNLLHEIWNQSIIRYIESLLFPDSHHSYSAHKNIIKSSQTS